MTIIRNATADQLSDAMEIDHVIRVLEGHTIDTSPDSGLYAPTMLDDALDSEEWTLITGRSGQYGYDGPTFHNSEYIGGGLADYILDFPGYYVAILSDHSPQTPEDEAQDEAGEYDGIEGWGIAHQLH